jgi:DNA-directed RNA polymerase specialized sigma24 family protein
MREEQLTMPATLNPYAHIDGYEIFRRAIVDSDEMAWVEGIARYRALLVLWASRSVPMASISERGEDIADQAVSRAWATLSPVCFERFPTLAAVLAYLRTCVTTTIIDCARGEQVRARQAQAFEAGDIATPEQIIMAHHDQQALWKIVLANVQSELERVVLIETFVYDQPPRAILTRYPQLFASANDVYNTKRNLFERLKRCPELRHMYQEI